MRRTGPGLFVLILAVTACGKPVSTTKSELPTTNSHQAAEAWHVPTGALDPDCSHGGKNPDGSFQFMSPCPASFTSPDGQWRLVIRKPENGDAPPPVTLESTDGKRLFRLSQLSDDMPFVLFWSPRPGWFLVNHYVGSGTSRPEVYEITTNGVALHKGITLKAKEQAVRISPCLRKAKWDWVNGTAVAWSNDGEEIAWKFYTRIDACMGPKEFGPVPPSEQWKSFWMISNAASGAIQPGSVRVKGDEESTIDLLSDPSYAEFKQATRA